MHCKTAANVLMINFRRVERDCSHMSPSRTIWYRSAGGDALRLGR